MKKLTVIMGLTFIVTLLMALALQLSTPPLDAKVTLCQNEQDLINYYQGKESKALKRIEYLESDISEFKESIKINEGKLDVLSDSLEAHEALESIEAKHILNAMESVLLGDLNTSFVSSLKELHEENPDSFYHQLALSQPYGANMEDAYMVRIMDDWLCVQELSNTPNRRDLYAKLKHDYYVKTYQMINEDSQGKTSIIESEWVKITHEFASSAITEGIRALAIQQ